MKVNQKEKRKLTGIIISMIVLTIGVSYAYFTATLQNLGVRTTELSTQLLGTLKLTAESATYTSGGQYPGDMAIQKFYIEPVSAGVGIYEIDLTGVVDSVFGSDIEIQLYKSLDNTEVTVTEGEVSQTGGQFSREDTLVTNGLTPIYTGTLKNGENILLQEDFEVVNSSGLKIRENSTDTAVNKYTFYLVYYYKNRGNQNAQMGQTFSGTVSGKMIQEKRAGTPAELSLYYRMGITIPGIPPDPGVIMDEGDISSGETDVVACTKTYAYDDYGNLRFVGTQPCNYIVFNEEEPELEDYFYTASSEGEAATDEYSETTMDYSTVYGGWRIIGVFDGYIKIMRNDSIGYYSWDTSDSNINSGYGINQWGRSGSYMGADLMKLLNPGNEENLVDVSSGESIYINNSLYWNRESGHCYTGAGNIRDNYECNFTYSGLKSSARDMIDNHTWYLGSIDNNYAGNKTPSKVYEFERGELTGKSCQSGNLCDDDIARTTTWEGYVGLPYASDYGYAVGGSVRESCLTKGMESYNDAESCYGFNWLALKPYSLTMTPYTFTNEASRIAVIDEFGRMLPRSASYNWKIRPTVYLKADVEITGSGTPTDPFRITMN